MRALAISEDGIALVDAPDPSPRDDEVVVAVQACGICGSDLKMAGVASMAGKIIGHEFSGTIVDLGGGVEGWSSGQHVAVNPLGSCGECEACRKRLPFLCRAVPNIGLSASGAFAERVVVPARQLSLLPGPVDVEVGSHAEPLAVALSAIELSEIEAGAPALVLGVGTIGLFVIAGLRAMGAGTIVAVGRSKGRRRAAATYGADVVIDAREGDLAGRLGALGVSFAAAFECTGAPEMFGIAAPLLAIRGSIVDVALSSVPSPVDHRSLVGKGLRIIGVCAFAESNYLHAVELLASGRVDADPIVSERVALAEAPDAFARLHRPDDLVGILVEPWR